MEYVIDQDGVLYNGQRILTTELDGQLDVRHFPLTNVVLIGGDRGHFLLRSGEQLNVFKPEEYSICVNELDSNRIIIGVCHEEFGFSRIIVYDVIEHTELNIPVHDPEEVDTLTLSSTSILVCRRLTNFEYLELDPVTLATRSVWTRERDLTVVGFLNGGTRALGVKLVDYVDVDPINVYTGLDITESGFSEPVFRIQCVGSNSILPGGTAISESGSRFALIDGLSGVKCFDSDGKILHDDQTPGLVDMVQFDGESLIVYLTDEESGDYYRAAFNESFTDGESEVLGEDPQVFAIVPDTVAVLL
jgi:hypothetical protein